PGKTVWIFQASLTGQEARIRAHSRKDPFPLTAPEETPTMSTATPTTTAAVPPWPPQLDWFAGSLGLCAGWHLTVRGRPAVTHSNVYALALDLAERGLTTPDAAEAVWGALDK